MGIFSIDLQSIISIPQHAEERTIFGLLSKPFNWKGSEEKWLWPNLLYYPEVAWRKSRKIRKLLSNNGRSQGRDLNPRPPQYEEWSAFSHDFQC
jgi:hypothetical protein